VTMEGDVLAAVEEIEGGTRDASEPLEVRDGGGVDVDTADASEARDQVAHARVPGVEAARATAQAAEEVEVADLRLTVGDEGRRHRRTRRVLE
jgi:hypothetical protein